MVLISAAAVRSIFDTETASKIDRTILCFLPGGFENRAEKRRLVNTVRQISIFVNGGRF